MAGTVIIQSHRGQGLPGWIATCLQSVRDWSEQQGYQYRFIGDAMMARVPSTWRTKTSAYPQIAADLGRLYLLHDALLEGASCAVWIDADVFVHRPAGFGIETTESFAFGREIWIEPAGNGYRARRNVHNALVVMKPGNPVLDFYIHTAESILSKLCAGDAPLTVPPQIIGPKLLGALNNLSDFPLLGCVGMISPPVLRDIASGRGAALDMFCRSIDEQPGAVNLSASVIEDDLIAEEAIARLRATPAMLNTPNPKEAA